MSRACLRDRLYYRSLGCSEDEVSVTVDSAGNVRVTSWFRQKADVTMTQQESEEMLAATVEQILTGVAGIDKAKIVQVAVEPQRLGNLAAAQASSDPTSAF